MIEGISKKLIHRHPHVYGDVKVENEEEDNIEEKDKIKKYREQDKAEDNYELYIRNTIINLFKLME